MKATLNFNALTGKFEAIAKGQVVVRSNSKDYVVNTIRQGRNPKAIKLGVTDIDEGSFAGSKGHLTGDANQAMEAASALGIKKQNATITERFGFLASFTSMVLSGATVSLLVTGEGGLGKTYTVMKEIRDAGLDFTHDHIAPEGTEADLDWANPGACHVIKGFSTAKGLYRTLYENNHKIVIFDDCDSIFKDPNAMNILKGALDSSDERWISWNAETRFGDDSLPRRFKFEGRVIFISNLPQHKIEQALLSRSMRVDLSMNAEEKIERMETISQSDEFLPQYSQEVKNEALAFLKEHKDEATDLNMRTLITVCKVRASLKNWQAAALYTITA